MAISPYLRIPDLDSQVKSRSFKGWVTILSYGFGNGGAVPGSTGGSTGSGAGRASVHSINMVKMVDDLSAPLFERVSSGRRMDEAVLFLEGMPPGSAMAVLLMKKVFVDSVQYSGTPGGDDTPMESLSLSFDTMQYMPLAQYLSLKGLGALAGLLNWFR